MLQPAAVSGQTTARMEGRNVFQPLAPALMELQRRLKRAFDPHRICNRGRMYAGV